jgi:squalene/oxidosqualene cyclase-like protein
LLLEGLVDNPIPDALLKESVLLLLSFQNPSGGWSTYELKRGPDWLEKLNPSQVFSDIIVDYPYVECTSACVQALVRARNRFPAFKEKEVNRAIERGVRFIRDQQGPDGGFEGSWAVCFTYGTWFAVFGLRAAGVPVSDPAIMRAAFFLLNHQNEDGGWGEHYSSCIEKRYIPSRESHVVNTAWALLTLVKAGRGNTEAAHRAARYLVENQQEDGDWPRQSLIGVFNKTALINYENYRRYFPIWALSLYRLGLFL